MKTIWIVDEDEDNVRQYTELLNGAFKVRSFEMIYDAYSASGDCDIAILDISALSANMTDPLHHAYSPICGFIKKHPNTHCLIVSGFTKQQLAETFERIAEIHPEALIEYVDCLDDALLKKFKELTD